jgi:rSAM/selenodomain-associated transferase 2/rSAM/selenodomain-associated transferase 1
MTRYPEPGAVKTRLAASVGDAEAARIHGELARYVLSRARASDLSGAVALEVRLAGGSSARGRRWLGRRVRVRPQADGTLGDRLADAMRTAFAEGAPSAIAIGSDCPDAGGEVVRQALAALERSPVVLGPAEDGGYYLVGVRADSSARVLPALFGEGIEWGSADVLNATLARLAKTGIEPELLPVLADIDRPEDLPLWERRRGEGFAAERLSVVVPALDEEANVASAVSSARAAGAAEVVVADGGSRDATIASAEAAGARVVRAVRGRASQMNAGAASATGDVLLFLHADTTLPPDAAEQVRRVLADPAAVGGAFRFSAGDPAHALDRFVTAVTSARYAVFRLPYGDQAIFVRRRVFEDLGGFPELPVMEDYEFALRLRRLGRLGRAPGAACTSARVWHTRGLLRPTLIDVAIIAGYRLGVGAGRLARLRASR